MKPFTYPTTAALLGIGLAAWLAGSTAHRTPARAAEPAAASPALRHQFINNLDAGKQPPDTRGYVTVTFKTPLPAPPTIFLQCPNPRYTVKVHGVSPANFVFALYRTRDLLESDAPDPFTGPKAAKPVTNYRAAENIDVAWMAVAGE